MTEQNLVWHEGMVRPEERQALLHQVPRTIWFTGLSGAGKSTLAMALERRLIDFGHASYVLDGDNVRHGLNHDLGFSPDDRRENIRRIAEVARLMNDAGLIVLTAFISPYRRDREMAREIVGADRFVEVFVSTPLVVCEQRDPKGLYRRARQGGVAEFTGINAPYEEPLSPALAIDTARCSLPDCLGQLIAYLEPLNSAKKKEYWSTQEEKNAQV